MKNHLFHAVVGLALFFTAPNFVLAAEFMFRARVDGKLIEGKPLNWTSQHMWLLGRDGWMREFNPKDAKEAVKTGPSFAPYSAGEMREMLRQEFDNRFEVTLTRHYVVVHPRGQRDVWANRFEDLYNRLGHYFRIRGFPIQDPAYPIVAVAFRDRAEYFQYAAASGTPLHPNTLGHYDWLSNRVFLFDETGDKAKADWSENEATIVHEATHQAAFNMGIHRRFADPPRWLVEGLATMFEAPGVWSERYDHTQADRINRGRLDGFKKYAATRRSPGALMRLLTTDDAFRTDPDGAYAEGWALSFYLSETQPKLYAAYLEKTAQRPMFSDYPAVERLADFQAIFGTDLKLFDAKFLRYVREIK